MNKKFNPEKYGMMVWPVCAGHGRIRNPDDVKVCQNCGGFGFIRKEGKTFGRKDRQISTTL
jgi:DnaJ-class molecular chaperone